MAVVDLNYCKPMKCTLSEAKSCESTDAKHVQAANVVLAIKSQQSSTEHSGTLVRFDKRIHNAGIAHKPLDTYRWLVETMFPMQPQQLLSRLFTK
jgi:hypothetical protein